jgi:hypothetical protein
VPPETGKDSAPAWKGRNDLEAPARGLRGLALLACPRWSGKLWNRETDPSKIAVGFGGTLNLVASLLYVLLILALMAAPWHLLMAPPGSDLERPAWLWPVAGPGLALGLAAGAAAVVLPLRAGIRALQRMEF